MELIYRQATPDDLVLLTESRVTVLRAANRLSQEADMTLVRERSYDYYQRALKDGSHVAYLVFDGTELAGTGGVSFYSVMPTYHNPSGKGAYIMNMYTAPAYRRQGVASQTLKLLVSAARERGITRISLEATEMGRPLYLKHGFVPMPNELELPFE